MILTTQEYNFEAKKVVYSNDVNGDVIRCYVYWNTRIRHGNGSGVVNSKRATDSVVVVYSIS